MRFYRGIQRELRRQRPCYVKHVYTGSKIPEKPSFASQYGNEQVEFVRQTCLYVATKLGDLLHDLVVVGGLAFTPSHAKMGCN